MIARKPAANGRIGPEITIVPLDKIALGAERMGMVVEGVVDQQLDHGICSRVPRPDRKTHRRRSEHGWREDEFARPRHRTRGEGVPIRDHAAGERCIVERAVAPLRRIARGQVGGALPRERRARRIDEEVVRDLGGMPVIENNSRRRGLADLLDGIRLREFIAADRDPLRNDAAHAFCVANDAAVADDDRRREARRARGEVGCRKS